MLPLPYISLAFQPHESETKKASQKAFQSDNCLPDPTRENPLNDLLVKVIRTRRPPKLDTRAEQRLVRFIARNPFETLTCLSTPEKSGYRMHVNTTRKYSPIL
jgi:hypothetical protein